MECLQWIGQVFKDTMQNTLIKTSVNLTHPKLPIDFIISYLPQDKYLIIL